MYGIAARGRTALAEWLGEPVDHQVGRIEILLKLFLATEGEPAAARDQVAAFRRDRSATRTR